MAQVSREKTKQIFSRFASIHELYNHVKQISKYFEVRSGLKS